jgi:2-haloacid dehalogenase
VAELDRFEALSFDCYGTMIDWEAGITRELRAWLTGEGRAVGDDELLGRFAEVETVIEAQHPTMRYPDVLAEALRRIGALLGVPVDDATADRFGESVGRWPAFDDSAEALARLSTKYLLIVVSNVDRASFARSNERLGVGFDLVITAEDVGAYKPADANFEALLAGAARLGAAPIACCTSPRACTTTTSRRIGTDSRPRGSTGDTTALGTARPRHRARAPSHPTGGSRRSASSPTPPSGRTGRRDRPGDRLGDHGRSRAPPLPRSRRRLGPVRRSRRHPDGRRLHRRDDRLGVERAQREHGRLVPRRRRL